MSMRDFRPNKNWLAISGIAAESAMNTAQSVDMSLHIGNDAMFTVKPRREPNEGEATGYEFPSDIHDRGEVAEGSLPMPYMRPQDIAFAAAFANFDRSTSAAGAGYLHQFTPSAGVEPKTYTAIMREGADLVAVQMVSLANSGFSMKFERDGFVTLDVNAVGTGKYSMDEVSESVQALMKATAVEISNSVLSDNVKYVGRVAGNMSSCWADCSVSAANSNILSISPPGAVSTLISYLCEYRSAAPTWLSLPAKVSELAFRTNDMDIVFDGALDLSTLAITGGHHMAGAFERFQLDYNNNAQSRFVVNAGGNYADEILCGNHTATVSIDRQRRDLMLEHGILNNRTSSLIVKGEKDEFDTGHNHTVCLYIPRLGATEVNKTANGEFLQDAANYQVLQNSATPGMYLFVKTTIATFAG